MERNGRPRRRPEAPSAPTSLHEITRRYYATAIALSKALAVPCTETFLREHRESISCCFIEAGRAGVRLPSGVQLPPLAQANGQPDISNISADNTYTGAPAGDVPDQSNTSTGNTLAGAPEADVPDLPPPPKSLTVKDLAPTNGDTPSLSVIATVADLPIRIPAGLQLPCAEALIRDLRPAQLALLCGKVGLRALADKTLEPLHVALLRERARRFEGGTRAEASAHGA